MLAWVLLGSALGEPFAEDDLETRSQVDDILGWTADERTAVARVVREAWVFDDSVRSSILAVPSGDVGGCFHIGGDPWPGCETSFATWKKQNPLTEGTAGKRCGEARVSFRVQDTRGYPEDRLSSSWEDGAQLIGGSGEGYLFYGVELDGRVWTEQAVRWGGAETAWWTGKIGVEPFWSPSCARIAWVETDHTPVMARSGYAPELLAGSVSVADVGPRIEVLAPENLSAASKTLESVLLKHGYSAKLGPAMKEREASVIYTWSRARPVAERLAKLIPGGASIEPLTWKSSADIVVAVGASAR